VTGWEAQFKLAEAAKSTSQSSNAAHSDQEKDASSDKVFVSMCSVRTNSTIEPPVGLTMLASRRSSTAITLHSPAWNGTTLAPADQPRTSTTSDAIETTASTAATLTSTSVSQNHLDKPTCSLNLLCYRPGYQGCVLKQITVIGRSRYPNEDAYNKALGENKNLVSSDEEFFQSLHAAYSRQMCSFWRRHFSMKTLQQIRLLSVSTFRIVVINVTLGSVVLTRHSIQQQRGPKLCPSTTSHCKRYYMPTTILP
jgi:hypothetical protein